jgi:ParB family chromosome partitioning protein
MKNAENLKARLGSNMAESMGDVKPGAGGLPSGFAAPTGQYAGCTRIKDALSIDVTRIIPDPHQPRKEFDEAALDELAASLKTRGQLQPIRVRWAERLGMWVIIAGERRFRAALRAGLETVACIEARGEAAASGDVLEDQLVENCLREDLKPIEQARAFKTLMERRGWSYRELGEFLHISKGKIAKTLALLDLAEPVAAMVEQGALAPIAAYEISRMEGADAQIELANRVVAEQLTVQDAAAIVKSDKLGVRDPVPSRSASKTRPIQVELRPGVTVSIKGIASDEEAAEACLEAAVILQSHCRDRDRETEQAA